MKTLKLRIYDSKIKQLEKLASSVNFVWNYVNELSYKYLQRTGKFLSAYDLNDYTKGSGELLGLHSQTIQAINETHAKSRKQFKKVQCGTNSVGLDLGCKDSVTTSNGDKLITKFTQKYANKLAKAQRANKKKQVKTIHACQTCQN
ncbi:Uncharacterised protein [Moraxella lacunata]|uniref:Transposase n=1 Tax=Moraxella lacunata TaxID=477 RepID=A0A378QKT1_MORLA|nr:Uncharacterised protein [Moraxella lacunata]